MWHTDLEGYPESCRGNLHVAKALTLEPVAPCDEACSNRKIKPACVASEGCQGRHLTTKVNRLT